MNVIDSEFIDDNFFLLSSENSHEFNSRLYGYAIFNRENEDIYDVYINGSVNDIPLDADGAFVNITSKKNSIRIQQDFNGCYGLYFFKKDDFYAISNSFLYLMEKMKDRFELSLNQDFAKYFISERLASLSVSETLINEINILPKDVVVNIDLQSNRVKTDRISKKEESIALDSLEGLSILDQWFHKWQGLLVNLKNNGEKIKVDLTGGMDSRAVFAIFNSPIIDLNSIEVNSSTGKLHTHIEDFEIASIIADRYSFDLNQRLNTLSYDLDTNTSMAISFYTKLGLHKQLHFATKYDRQRTFYFTGSGGESIRKHWQMEANEYIRKEISSAYDKFTTINYSDSMSNIISRSIRSIKEADENDIDLMKNLYANTRLRSHFGKSAVEKFLENKIYLNPLMDKQLQRIHNNDDTLLCVIYDRYLNQLNDIKFEGGRKLDLKVFENAQKINKSFPYTHKTFFREANIIDNTKFTPEKSKKTELPKKKMMDLLYTDKIRNLVTDLLGDEPYRKAMLNWEKGGFFPESLAISLIAIAISHEASLRSKNIFDTADSLKLYSNSNIIRQISSITKTMRLDIKNSGNHGNDLIFLKTQRNFELSRPKWFQENGSGYIVESDNLFLNLSLQCVNDGTIEIILRGIDIRDEYKERLECKIDFTSLKINDIEHIESIKDVWHDKPYKISQPVKNDEVIDLQIRWQPHSYEKDQYIDMLNKLFQSL